MRKLGLVFTILIAIVFTISCVNKEVPVAETYHETEYKTEYKTESYTTAEDVVVKTVEGSELLNTKVQWRSSWVYLTGGKSDITCYYGYDISSQEHSRSNVQISLNLQPQLHKGIVYAVDLTDACYDQSVRYPEVLFGWLYSAIHRGCQLDQPTWKCAPMGSCMLDAREYMRHWLDGFNSLGENSARILVELSADKATTEYDIAFDAKGIKEFAVIASVIPEVKPQIVKLTWSDDITEKQTVTKERQVPYEVAVQLEKQRTVMQTQKVPFWEAVFH
jgi:hypothetical protein